MRIDYSLNDTTSGRTHSDIAFWGNTAVAGNYDGFRIFNTDTHQLLVSYLCRGPQNDVSLWPASNGHLLLFLSNDTPQTNGATVCSQNRLSDTTACGPACFEGIRIFDLTDPSSPQLIHAVYTDCGSHTHTLVPDLANNRVLLYVSSYPSSTGPNCQSPHAKISIVAVPLDAPETASVIATPPVDAPPFIGVGCHDITVFMAIHKAAAEPGRQRCVVVVLVQRQDLSERHRSRRGRFQLRAPGDRVRRHLHAPERADAGRPAAVDVRDAGPVTAAPSPPPRRPDGPVGPPGTPSTRYCSSTRVAFASPRLTK
jgi:hypothetical protein